MIWEGQLGVIKKKKRWIRPHRQQRAMSYTIHRPGVLVCPHHHVRRAPPTSNDARCKLGNPWDHGRMAEWESSLERRKRRINVRGYHKRRVGFEKDARSGAGAVRAGIGVGGGGVGVRGGHVA